jgi:hypothetical protein
MLQQQVPGGSLLEVQFYAFNFTGPQASPDWITQSMTANVPPGGTRLVASVASWQIAFASVENKLAALGVAATADPYAFPQITASIYMSAFNPSDPTVVLPNPWTAWVNVQVLIFA